MPGAHGPHGGRATRRARVQRSAGYRIAAAFAGDAVAAVAGFRVTTNLVSGLHLYVDDLVTAPEHRQRGHARALLTWCAEEAARCGCGTLELDSGVGPDRRDAHTLYFSVGMGIRSYHFTRPVGLPRRPELLGVTR